MADRGKKRVESPVDLYIEYSGKFGRFTYYDKEKKENIEFPISRAALITDERFKVSGFSKKHNNGIYSNEVGDLKEELDVRIFQKKGQPIELVKGVWADIKDSVKAAGGKFAKVIYFAQDSKLIHATIDGCAFSGATHYERKGEDARGGWINFDTRKFMERVFAFEGTVEGQETADVQPYYAPVFAWSGEMEPDEVEAAETFYKLLQDYFGASGEEREAEPTQDTNEKLTDTSNWRSYEIEPGVELGSLGLNRLKFFCEQHNEKEDYGVEYDMICAGIQELEKETAPPPPAHPEETPLAVSEWPNCSTPNGNKLGNLTIEQMEQSLEWVKSSNQHTDMIPYLEEGIKELKNPQETEAAGMPSCF